MYVDAQVAPTLEHFKAKEDENDNNDVEWGNAILDNDYFCYTVAKVHN